MMNTETKDAAKKPNVPLGYIDYKNLKLLREYTTRYGKIRPRYYSGVPLRFQKHMARAIKRARFMALLPFVK